MKTITAARAQDRASAFWLVAVSALTLLVGLMIAMSSANAVVTKKVQAACKKDYYRHCPSYSIGTPQLRTCMTKAGKRKQLRGVCLRALINAGEVPRRYLKKR
jgi:hypothetical protein